MPNPEPLFVSDALLQQAERVCRARLAKDADSPVGLATLAKILLKQGRIDDAAALYERLATLEPDNQEAVYMRALTTGTDGPAPPAGIQPSPFVFLKNFLPKDFHESLMPFALTVEDQLVPALVGNDEYRPNTRESLEFRGQSEIRKRFGAIVRQVLPDVAARLHVPPFEIGKLEVKMRTYLDGHFFRIHMDNPAGSDTNADRRVSFVYFYHKVPRAYTGGELLVFETDIANNRYTTAGFTRIVPEDNSIIFFPSSAYHSVVPVSCPSKQFADSRFVINGHVSRVSPPKPEAETPATTAAGATVTS